MASNRKIVQFDVEMHPKQLESYFFTTQYGAAIAGHQSGKTFVGACWANKKICEFQNGVGLIAAPTYKILQQSTLEKFFTLFPEYRRFYKAQEKLIALPSGGKIYLRSTDEPLGLEGMTLDWAWLDEVGQMKRIVWSIIRARVAVKRGQVFMTTTPYNMGWLYREVYLPWKEGTEPNISIFNWKSVENPFFPADFAESERRRLSPEEYARRYEGEFTRMEGLVWDIPPEQIFNPDAAIFKSILSYRDNVKGGVDWGFEKPCGVLVAIVKDGKYYITDEWKKERKTTGEIGAQCKAFEENYKKRIIWYPDKAEPDRIEEFKRMGLLVGDTNKDIALGVSHVAELIRTGNLFISQKCPELLDEMGQYHFRPHDEDKEDTREKPFKTNDHLCDALRYMCMGYRAADMKKVQMRRMAEAEMENSRFTFEYQ